MLGIGLEDSGISFEIVVLDLFLWPCLWPEGCGLGISLGFEVCALISAYFSSLKVVAVALALFHWP